MGSIIKSMEHFLILIKCPERTFTALPEAERLKYIEAWHRFIDVTQKNGTWVSGFPVEPEYFTLSRDGLVGLDSRENLDQVTGFMVLRAADRSGLLDKIRLCPTLAIGGTLEIFPANTGDFARA